MRPESNFSDISKYMMPTTPNNSTVIKKLKVTAGKITAKIHRIARVLSHVGRVEGTDNKKLLIQFKNEATKLQEKYNNLNKMVKHLEAPEDLKKTIKETQSIAKELIMAQKILEKIPDDLDSISKPILDEIRGTLNKVTEENTTLKETLDSNLKKMEETHNQLVKEESDQLKNIDERIKKLQMEIKSGIAYFGVGKTEFKNWRKDLKAIKSPKIELQNIYQENSKQMTSITNTAQQISRWLKEGKEITKAQELLMDISNQEKEVEETESMSFLQKSKNFEAMLTLLKEQEQNLTLLTPSKDSPLYLRSEELKKHIKERKESLEKKLKVFSNPAHAQMVEDLKKSSQAIIDKWQEALKMLKDENILFSKWKIEKFTKLNNEIIASKNRYQNALGLIPKGAESQLLRDKSDEGFNNLIQQIKKIIANTQSTEFVANPQKKEKKE